MARDPTSAAPERDSDRLTDRQGLIEELESHFSSRGVRRRQERYWRAASWTLVIRLLAAFRRCCDLVFALLLICLWSPVLVFLFAMAKAKGRGMSRRTCLGRWAVEFDELRFDFPATSGLRFIAGLPVLINVLRGEMSFVGPRPVSPREILPSERNAWKRYDVRPGVIGLWWIRKRANMAYQSEVELDAEYTETHSFWGDVGIMARALPALAYGEGVSLAPEHVTLLQIRIDNLTLSDAADRVVALASGDDRTQLCFVNADCINIAFQDPEYRRLLNQTNFVLADGIGVRLAGRILNQHIRENVNGTDFLPRLCAAIEATGLGLYLLGGQPGVSDDAVRWIEKHYPGVKVAGHRHGFFTAEEEPGVITQIRESGAQILMVAFGVPKQEKWIFAHQPALGTQICIGVGGLFDFYSGRIPRAPVWMRELGMEWFYRFIQEPRRMWRRYFVGNAIFLYRVLRERLAHSQAA